MIWKSPGECCAASEENGRPVGGGSAVEEFPPECAAEEDQVEPEGQGCRRGQFEWHSGALSRDRIEPVRLFGPLHLALLAGIAIAAVALVKLCRVRTPARRPIRLALGWGLALN